MQNSPLLTTDKSLEIIPDSDGEVLNMLEILQKLGDQAETFDRDMIYGGLNDISSKLVEFESLDPETNGLRILGYVDGKKVQSLGDLNFAINQIKGKKLTDVAEKQLIKQITTVLAKIIINKYREFFLNEIERIVHSTISQLSKDEYLNKLLTNRNANAITNFNTEKNLRAYLESKLMAYFKANLVQLLLLLSKSSDDYFHNPRDSKVDMVKLKNLFSIDIIIEDGISEFHQGMARSTIARKVSGSDYNKEKMVKAVTNQLNGSAMSVGFSSNGKTTETDSIVRIIRDFASLVKFTT